MPPRRQVLVDELQDLSPKQLAIVRALLPEDGCGFFGIGDPDQAIYGFRGAHGQDEESIRAVWPALRVFHLARSYRAGQGVLDAARRILRERGQCGALHAVRPLASSLHLFAAPTPQAEARWIAGHTARLLGGSSLTLHKEGEATGDVLDGSLSPGDIAVLVRIRAQIPPIREALEAAGIPCRAPAEESCTQDDFCRTVLLAAAQAEKAAERVPSSWGEAAKRLAGQGRHLPQEDIVRAVSAADGGALPPEEAGRELCRLLEQGSSETGLYLRHPAWRQLCRQWRQAGDWSGLLRHLVWEEEAEALRARTEQVQIMTMHASKGLEFRAVFLPGLEDGRCAGRPSRDRLRKTQTRKIFWKRNAACSTWRSPAPPRGSTPAAALSASCTGAHCICRRRPSSRWWRMPSISPPSGRVPARRRNISPCSEENSEEARRFEQREPLTKGNCP